MLVKQIGIEKPTTHPLYATWRMMNYRCYSKNHQSYNRYGGRGISVCEEWRWDNPRGLLNFLGAVGERPDGLTLDRKDVDGNYEPSNCRWATKKVQQNNRRTEKDTESGRLGVVHYKGKWKAQIYVNETTLCLGVFKCVDDAIELRKRAEEIKATLGDQAVVDYVKANKGATPKGRRQYSRKTSNFYGVSWDKARSKWRATLTEVVAGKHKQVALGRFDTEEAANEAVISYLKEKTSD